MGHFPHLLNFPKEAHKILLSGFFFLLRGVGYPLIPWRKKLLPPLPHPYPLIFSIPGIRRDKQQKGKIWIPISRDRPLLSQQCVVITGVAGRMSTVIGSRKMDICNTIRVESTWKHQPASTPLHQHNKAKIYFYDIQGPDRQLSLIMANSTLQLTMTTKKRKNYMNVFITLNVS